MPKSLRPLLPASSSPGPSSTTSGVNASAKRRRYLVRAACNSCRSRKKAVSFRLFILITDATDVGHLANCCKSRQCDAKRPQCTPCVNTGHTCIYVTENVDETPMMALRRENTSLKRLYGELIEVLDLLEDVPDDAAVDIWRHLKTSRDPTSILSSIRSGVHVIQHPSESRTARSFSPPTQSGLEFELTVRHPMTFPTLVPVNTVIAPSNPLLRAGRFCRQGVAEILYNGLGFHRRTRSSTSLALLLT